MTALVLTPQESTLWQIALAVGGVVIVAVIALLGMLLYLIRSIAAGASRLQETAEGVAGHTHKLREIGAVDSRLHAVGAEAQRHADLLGRKQGAR